MSRVEWWTDPADAAERLDALTQQWSDLSNAALGRGVTPLVREPLATEVATLTARFRTWRGSIGGYQNILTWRGPLESWTERANATRAKLMAGGVRVPDALPEFVGPGALGGPFALAAVAIAALYMLARGRS